MSAQACRATKMSSSLKLDPDVQTDKTICDLFQSDMISSDVKIN